MHTPLSAPGRSGPTATSNIRTPAPGDDVRRNWASIAQVASALAGQAGGLQALRDRVNTLKTKSCRLADLHPFRIYQLPPVLRDNGGDITVDWLKFRVRAGRVKESDALGTDGEFNPAANADPDSEFIPLEDADISAPGACAKFWFWLEIGADDAGSTEAIVRYGPDPKATSYSDEWETTAPWSNFPVPDAAHVPIGWVDTLTHASCYTPVIRQLLRSDLVGGVGGNGLPVWL